MNLCRGHAHAQAAFPVSKDFTSHYFSSSSADTAITQQQHLTSMVMTDYAKALRDHWCRHETAEMAT
jgi:hypothetical protein